MGVYDLWHKKPQPEDIPCDCSGGKQKQYPSMLHGKGDRWQVQWDIYPDGKRKRQKKNFALKVGKDPEKHADAYDKKIQGELAAGLIAETEPDATTLRDIYPKWSERQVMDSRSLKRFTRSVESYIFPVLGDIPMPELVKDEDVIQAWITALRDKPLGPLGPRTIKQYAGRLRQLLDYACRKGIISSHPMRDKLVNFPTVPQRKVTPYRTDQLERIHDELPEEFRPVWWLGTNLGIRFAEIQGASPEDAQDNQFHISRQIKRLEDGGGYVFALPKGQKTRFAPFPDKLKAYLATVEPTEVTLPWERPDGELVTVPIYLPLVGTSQLHSMHLWGIWDAALKRAGVASGTGINSAFHMLRHTYASLLLSRGVDIRSLSEWLGHADAAVTFRYYAHFIPQTADRARRILDDVTGMCLDHGSEDVSAG